LRCPKSGKPDFGGESFRARLYEEDGLQGHKRVHARLPTR